MMKNIILRDVLPLRIINYNNAAYQPRTSSSRISPTQTMFVGPVRYMSRTLPTSAVRLTVSSPPGKLIAAQTEQAQRRCDRAAAGAAGQREILNSTLVGYRFDMPAVHNLYEADVCPARKLFCEPQGAAKRAKRIAVTLIPIGHENYRVRDAGVAKLNVCAVVHRAAGAHAPVQVYHAGVVEPHFVQPLCHALPGDEPGGSLDALNLPGQAVFVSVAGDASRAVPAHLAQTAVGIIEDHAEVAALPRRGDDHHPVRADGDVLGAQPRQRRFRYRAVDIVYNNEVVSGSVHFGEAHRLSPTWRSASG